MNYSGSSTTSRRSTWLKFASATLIALAVAGCGGGSDGAPGATGATGATGQDVDPAVVDALTAKVTALAQAANPETCVTCHTGATPVAKSGSMHQAAYNQYYQDGVVKIVTGSMAIASDGVATTTLTFKMTKNGANFSCLDADSIGSYWASYDTATKTFPDDMSLVGTKAWDIATNVCTITKTVTTASDKAIVAKIAAAGTNGIVQIYGVDEILTKDSAKHLSSGKYPFAGVLKVGAGVDYSSAANVSGCESCHTTPFLKHTYIYGKVLDNSGAETQFYTCKGCHYDNRAGHDLNWQIEKDDPARAAAIAGGSPITAAETAKYGYAAKLMNDVHMSHNMEFPYPQSMKNCSTCHAGPTQLSKIFADAKFNAETCISCHSVDGTIAKMTGSQKGALMHESFVTDPATLKATDCSSLCHKAGGYAKLTTISTIHNGGFDPKIATAAGVRYSDNYKVTIDSTSVASNVLTIKFHATEATAIAGLSKNSITPTVIVGLYGYDTKDFIVAAHGSQADKTRNLEYIVGGTAVNPRFTTVLAANGSWEVTADLSLWADKIASGAIKRAEIAVMPELKDAAGTVLGLNAPSRTFDLTKNAFDDTYFKPIVKPLVDASGKTLMVGCNSCHDQLATTFHSGIRGGSVVVCRICHEVSNPGSHLEMQSRSIDSYVHAIHSFQAFDLEKIDLTDPVQAMEYKNHTGTDYPKFGIQDCESCHVAGTYDVPNQAKSMPGVLSGNETLKAGTRNIGTIAQSVTGPAARACGSCHRSNLITADDAQGLAILNAHFKQNGYMVDNETGLWDSIVTKIMTVFK